MEIPGDITKNRKPRTIQLDGDLLAIIERRHAAKFIKGEDGTTTTQESKFIFHRGDGRPICEFRKTWATVKRLAGVTCRWHDWRVTFATDARKAGNESSVVLRMGGWETPSVLKRYNLIDDKDVRQGMEKMKEFRTQAG